jgi:hypothetical protein
MISKSKCDASHLLGIAASHSSYSLLVTELAADICLPHRSIDKTKPVSNLTINPLAKNYFILL